MVRPGQHVYQAQGDPRGDQSLIVHGTLSNCKVYSMWCPVLLFGEIALEADAAADDISRWTATLKRRSACKLGKIKLVTVQLNLQYVY